MSADRLFLDEFDGKLFITKECECGCKQHIKYFYNVNTIARFVLGHGSNCVCKIKNKSNPIRLCKCGCETVVMRYDKNGNIRYFRRGHKPKDFKQSEDIIKNRVLKNTGKKRTKETKLKMRLSQLGTKQSKRTRNIKRLQRLQQIFPKHDTKPEKMLQQLLTLNSIKFDTQKIILGKTRVDVFIEPNICVFVDGCYWHFCNDENCKTGRRQLGKTPNNAQTFNLRRDTKINHLLNKNGYQVIRIWEHDVTVENMTTSKNILNLIVNTIQKRVVGGEE